MFSSADAINAWFAWMILAMFVVCHLTYSFGKPAHYRLRHRKNRPSTDRRRS